MFPLVLINRVLKHVIEVFDSRKKFTLFVLKGQGQTDTK